MGITPIQPMKGIVSIDELSRQNSEAGGGLSSLPFADVFKTALSDYEAAKAVSEADSAALALGDVDDLARVQINSMKAESMLQTTVQLTTRMVNAYKEIMQMQI